MKRGWLAFVARVALVAAGVVAFLFAVWWVAGQPIDWSRWL